jgi:hypothetical protein
MKLVLVEWIDASTHGNRNNWHPLDEIEDTTSVLKCKSVGWLVVDDKDKKVLVPHISGEANENNRPCGYGNLVIPSRAIKKMTVLKAG